MKRGIAKAPRPLCLKFVKGLRREAAFVELKERRALRRFDVDDADDEAATVAVKRRDQAGSHASVVSRVVEEASSPTRRSRDSEAAAPEASRLERYNVSVARDAATSARACANSLGPLAVAADAALAATSKRLHLACDPERDLQRATRVARLVTACASEAQACAETATRAAAELELRMLQRESNFALSTADDALDALLVRSLTPVTVVSWTHSFPPSFLGRLTPRSRASLGGPRVQGPRRSRGGVPSGGRGSTRVQNG